MKIFDPLHAFVWESMTANNCNAYFIDGPTRLLIDPGHRKLFGHVKSSLADLGIGIEGIGIVICTHAHPDHLEAASLFKETAALMAVHETEWQFVKAMRHHIMAAFGLDPDTLVPDILLTEGDLTVDNLQFQILHTPGHSPGSVSLYWPAKKALFTGDLVFKAGIGRTDLPGGDGEQLKKSVRRLAELDVEWILPGHGEIISGAKAVRANFLEIENYWFQYV